MFSRAAATGIPQANFKKADSDASGMICLDELEHITEALGKRYVFD